MLLEVLDTRGRVVRTLSNTAEPTGRYSVNWDGRDGAGAEVSPGVYFVRMRAGQFEAARKVMLIR